MPSHLDHCVALLQSLIAIPSLPGEEGELARRVAAEMESLGYHDVHTDEVGNVLGRVPGTGAAEPVMFNTHLDHVDVGDPAHWPHPPFGAEIHDGKIWGRGAVDIKGPMAAQIVGVARLLPQNGSTQPPPGDVWVSAVVQEEIGGVGAQYLVREGAQHCPRLFVVGEPSSNTIRRGHRGRVEAVIHLRGRSVHASVPERGLNPLISLGRILARLDEVELGEHAELGRSSVAPTLLRTDQTSSNVVPGEIWQICDWRLVPGEDPEDAVRSLDALVRSAIDPAIDAEVTLPVVNRRTWTGLDIAIPAANPAYLLPPDHPAVRAAEEIAAELLGPTTPAGVWKFATDGGHYAAAGCVPIGFGPGDELLAHTVDEHIAISELEVALDLNERLARELAQRTARTA